MTTKQPELQQLLEKVQLVDTRWRDRFAATENRISQMEAKGNLPLRNANGDRRLPPECRQYLLDVLSRKAVDLQSGTAGANAAPVALSDEVHSQVRRLSPLADLVRIEQSDTGQFKKIVSDTKHASGWAAETGTRSETGTAGLQLITPTYGMAYAYPKATEESVQDIFFDVTSWFVEETSRAFAQAIGLAIISGNGTARPTGFLNGTPVSTADGASPERAFGVPQYLPTGVAADFQGDRLASPQGDPGGVLFDALYALPSQHRQNATWVMNSLTLASIRKFRDADGNHLFTPGLIAGMDDVLLGRPIRICEDMPAVGANAFPVAIADWKAAYLLVRVGALRVTFDEITTPGYLKLYVRERIGGILMDSNAIKLIKCSTS